MKPNGMTDALRLGLMAALASALLLAGAALPVLARDADDPVAARAALVAEVERDVAMLRAELGADRLDSAVIAALGATPRHAFVPPELRELAYRNHPLPIGHDQTISQPLIVALMTHLLGVQAGDRVYELGTGSGYQAAVLAAMGVSVWSIEIVPELAERAAKVLRELGYRDVHVRAGDGYLGWPEAAPFDAVIVTAAIDHVPQPLVDQLETGGRLVMPIGAIHGIQQLAVFEKDATGALARRDVLSVQFVPLTGPGADLDE
jgi:protein-L-isoaspartate(D-aspartate) O-methyltransferase